MELKIDKVANLSGWKAYKILDTSDFVNVENCLCCKGKLKVIIKNKTENANIKIDIGCCMNCGFTTYINKPSHKWIIDFYNSTWNKEEGEYNNFVNKDLQSSKLTIALEKIIFPKNGSICEIGTGRGGNFAALINNGYTNLVGVENSIHRADTVSKALNNIPIYIGGFEEKKVQHSLKSHGKFDLIYTAHVMEHIYNPEETIELCSNLQDENGYLIVAVPNFVGEPSIGISSFLPHLHSFTKESMIRLLNNKGYEIIDDSYTTEFELFLIAQKKSSFNKKIDNKVDYKKSSQDKFIKELKLNEMPLNQPVFYYFSKKNYSVSGFKLLSKISIVRSLQTIYYKFIQRKKGHRSFVFTLIDKNKNQPIILNWKKSITLFYK